MSEEKKEGTLSRLWRSLRGKDLNIEQTVGELGLNVVKDQKFEARLSEFKQFCTYLKQTINPDDSLKKKLENTAYLVGYYKEQTVEINEKLITGSIPYGTGGSLPWYTKVSFAWSVIYSNTLSIIDSLDYLLNHKDEAIQIDAKVAKKVKAVPESHNLLRRVNTRILISAFNYFYKNIYIQYAQKMASLSWFERDITPPQVAVIQNIPQMGRGYELPKTRLTNNE